MGSSAPTSPHDWMQYLNAVLSQRGPSALPYREDVKRLIRQHLLDLMQTYPSLRVKSNPFVHNDGTAVNLLQVEGTIPMTYQGLTYNIPVCIWLHEGYPRSAPLVFVAPTKDMIIKRPHKHVDASGLVSMPYLQDWVYPRFNLAELAQGLSIMFGNDPPLYSKPPSASPRVQQLGTPQPISTHTFQASSGPNTCSSISSPARPYSTQIPLPPSPLYASTDNPSEVFRRNAISTLVERLKQDIALIQKTREAEMDEIITVQGHLKERQKQLQVGIQELTQEKEGLEQQLQGMLTNTDILQSWLKTHEKSCVDIDIDDVFEPSDVLSKQMLECTSADLAIEDALYALDKAVQEGSIPVDAYLKQVRILSREQFFHKAMYAKVRAAQVQIQVSNMAQQAVT